VGYTITRKDIQPVYIKVKVIPKMQAILEDHEVSGILRSRVAGIHE
jgi:hypothetical protein